MSTYKSFPRKGLITDWKALLKCTREEVVALYEEWKSIDLENQELYRALSKEKFAKIDEVVSYLKSQGIDVYKYKRGGILRERNGYQAWFKTNVAEPISKKYPSYFGGVPTAHMNSMEVDGVPLYNNQSPTNLVELYDRLTQQYRAKKSELEKTDKLLIASIAYATSHGIDIEGLSSKEIIREVHDHAIETYHEENLPDGTEIYLKNECDSCSSFFVGSYRCSCGSRRISIIIEGNIIEGFYHYPEAC